VVGGKEACGGVWEGGNENTVGISIRGWLRGVGLVGVEEEGEQGVKGHGGGSCGSGSRREGR